MLPGVKAGGDCTLSGQLIGIETFATDKARDAFLEGEKGVGDYCAEGPQWVIVGQNRPAVAEAAKAAGGTMVKL